LEIQLNCCKVRKVDDDDEEEEDDDDDGETFQIVRHSLTFSRCSKFSSLLLVI
jgi:hypothetical protein